MILRFLRDLLKKPRRSVLFRLNSTEVLVPVAPFCDHFRECACFGQPHEKAAAPSMSWKGPRWLELDWSSPDRAEDLGLEFSLFRAEAGPGDRTPRRARPPGIMHHAWPDKPKIFQTTNWDCLRRRIATMPSVTRP
ncbi:MAG: hypothetical protein KGL39_59665, partial [Patescibacteria group bacterium]|nr:hypothetical protein [Patescibacteria group bacterium]